MCQILVRWIDDYSGPGYQQACLTGLRKYLPSVNHLSVSDKLLSGVLEERVALEPLSQRKYAELASIWERCVKLERGFWDMAMSQAR